jgi:hypothetical protein
MLLNLLPGLRDLRAPLAAGYLWLAAGWLYFAPKLLALESEGQGVRKDIYEEISLVIHASGPVAVGAGLTFAAYIIGILSTGLLTEGVRRFVHAPIGPVYDLTTRVTIAIKHFMRWLSDLLGNPHDENMDDARDRRAGRMDWFLNPTRIRAESLVIQRITEMAFEDPDYREMLLEKLTKKPTRALRYFERYFTLSRAPTMELLTGKQVDEKEQAAELREILSSDLRRNSLFSAMLLVRFLVDVRRHAWDILGELDLIPEQLVEDRPTTFGRWDRLRGEGQFREAVVPPLLAIIAALVMRGALSWLFGLLLVVPVLVILFQGIGREHEADAQLILIPPTS